MCTERKRTSRKTREALYKTMNKRCGYCGKPITYGQMQVDHIMPLCKDGPDTKANKICSCASCNRRKGGMTLEEFRKSIIIRLDNLFQSDQSFQSLVHVGVLNIITPVIFYFEKLSLKKPFDPKENKDERIRKGKYIIE